MAKREPPRPKEPPIELDLELSLEEIARRVVRSVKFMRTVLLPDKRTTVKEEAHIAVEVDLTWRDGTMVVYGDHGHKTQPNVAVGDVIFRVKEAPHPYLVRSGSDLIYTHRVGIHDAIGGQTISVDVLKETVSLTVPEIVVSSDEKRLRGYGMPKADGSRGDLIVRFDVTFPVTLTPDQREAVRQVLVPA